jgi:hypothetical protein
MEELTDLLPELFQVIAEDLNRLRTLWFSQFDAFVDYVEAINRLHDILTMGDPEKEERAINVLKAFIESRKKPEAEWESPGCLAYELTKITDPLNDES